MPARNAIADCESTAAQGTSINSFALRVDLVMNAKEQVDKAYEDARSRMYGSNSSASFVTAGSPRFIVTPRTPGDDGFALRTPAAADTPLRLKSLIPMPDLDRGSPSPPRRVRCIPLAPLSVAWTGR